MEIRDSSGITTVIQGERPINMNANMNAGLNRSQQLLLALILVLPLLAWTGLLDRYSENYLDEALINAGVIFGTARGINALVSVLQGTEIDAFVLTVSIGELLDPINDLIERFSGAMLFALGSLAAQKILLQLISHDLFNTVLTLIALVTAFAYTRRRGNAYPLILRTFAVVVFLRFSLGLSVLANSWVDAVFLAQNEAQRHRSMESFQGELRQIGSQAGLNAPSVELTKDLEQQRLALQKTRALQQVALEQLIVELNAAESQLAQLPGGESTWSIPDLLSGDTPEVAAAKAKVKKLQARLKARRNVMDSTDQAIEQNAAAVECLQKRAAGEFCGLWDSISSKMSAAKIAGQITDLEEDMAEFSSNSISLLMSILLKSVLIPLLFFYLIFKVVQIYWAKV